MVKRGNITKLAAKGSAKEVGAKSSQSTPVRINVRNSQGTPVGGATAMSTRGQARMGGGGSSVAGISEDDDV